MKLGAERAAGFVARPDPKVAAVLLYGPDRGLVRESARTLVAAAVGDADDPFNVAVLKPELLKADPARLDDEAGALPLGGGRRAVWLQGFEAELQQRLQALLPGLSAATTLLLVEAGELPPRSPLRRLFEGAGNAVALPFYRDGAESLARLVRQSLEGHGLRVEPAALDYLVEHLGGDRLATRAELEKLALYKAGDPSPVSRADAEACVGDGAPQLIDDAIMAAAAGEQAALDRALGRGLAAGVEPVRLLRAVGGHLQRLHLMSEQVAAGASPASAVEAARPPVFWKLRPAMTAQLRLWSPERLARALALLLEAELQCKSTGLPAAAICGRALMRIAQAAGGGRR